MQLPNHFIEFIRNRSPSPCSTLCKMRFKAVFRFVEKSRKVRLIEQNENQYPYTSDIAWRFEHAYLVHTKIRIKKKIHENLSK